MCQFVCYFIGLVILCFLCITCFLFSCLYQRNQLPGKNCPRNDLLCLEWDVKVCSLTLQFIELDTLLSNTFCFSKTELTKLPRL